MADSLKHAINLYRNQMKTNTKEESKEERSGETEEKNEQTKTE